MKSLAKERAAFILEMADADEAQRNIKPLPETAFEARRRESKAFSKWVRDDIWHTITLPKLMGEWKAAREDNEDNPVYHRLVIRAAIEERKTHGRYVLDESLTATERGEWTEIFGQCRSMMTARFTRLTNAARGVLRRGSSATVTSTEPVGQS